MLKSKKDLGPEVVLRDFYGFGTLRLGDASFVSAFENSLLTPRNRPNLVWRVQLRTDIATTFPFGLADSAAHRLRLPPTALFNYGHVAPAIVLRPLLSPLGTTYRLDNLVAFGAATEVRVAPDAQCETHAPPSQGKRSWWKVSAKLAALVSEPANPLRWALALVVPPIYDHAPWSYLYALDNIGPSATLAPPVQPSLEAAARSLTQDLDSDAAEVETSVGAGEEDVNSSVPATAQAEEGGLAVDGANGPPVVCKVGGAKLEGGEAGYKVDDAVDWELDGSGAVSWVADGETDADGAGPLKKGPNVGEGA
ncbi:hypothetical protein JCM10207_001350 [Rhodosporidiobolus poonsookiae]